MPKYTVTFNKQNYDIESQNPLTKAELDEAVDNIANQQRANETVGEKVQGFGRAVGDAVTFGQAPHIAGEGKVIGGAIYDFLHGKNPLKELYNDYKSGKLADTYRQGREEYKNEQKKWETLHPKANFAGQAIGTLGTLPAGSAVAKIPAVAKYLKGAGILKKGALAGAGWGGAYGAGQGLSNTEGKGFDLENALIGGGIGAATGATLGTAIPLSVMGIKGGIKGILNVGKKLFLSKNTGRVGDYIRPEGIQEHSMQHILNDKEVAEEVAKGGIGKRVAEFTGEAQNSFDNARKTIDNEIKNAYQGIDSKAVINVNKKGIENLINDVEKNIGSDRPSQRALKEAKLVLKDINENGVELAKLKNLKDRLFRIKDSAFATEATGDTKRLVSQETVEMLDNFYNYLAQAEKDYSSQLKGANEYFAAMKDLNKEFAKINPKGLYGEDTIARAAAKQNKDMSGETFAQAEKNIREIIKKYPQVEEAVNKALTDLKKVQVASNIRPDENYATSFTIKKIIDHFIKGGSRDQRMQMFAQAVKDGKITQDMLNQQFIKARNLPVVTDIANYYLALGKTPQANTLMNVANNANKILDSIVPEALKGDTKFLNDLRQDVVNILTNRTIKDVNFGKLSEAKLQALNKIRQKEGVDLLENDNLVIPANVVRKLIDKRIIKDKMKPEEVADALIDVFHSDDIKMSPTKYKHIQAMLKIYDKISKIGFIGKNPENKDTVIKSLYKRDTDRLDEIIKGDVLDGRGFPSSVLAGKGKVAAPRFSALQNSPSNIIIPQKSRNVNSLIRNPLIPATNSRIRNILDRYYNKEQSK